MGVRDYEQREQPAGIALADLLSLPAFAGAEVLAGHRGLDRPILRFNVLDSPDVSSVARPRELLLTSGYPFRSEPEGLIGLVSELQAAGVEGLAIQLGSFIGDVPRGALEAADELGFPLLSLAADRPFDEILYGAFRALVNYQERRLSHSEQVHQSLMQIVLRGDGLDEIAAELAGLIDAPVAVVRSDGEILGASRLDEVEDLADRASARIDVTSERTVEVGGQTVATQSVIVSAGARLHGYVVAFVDEPDPMNRAALESTALAAALEVTKRLEVQAIEDKYRSDLMHDLVTHVDDTTDALRRAAGFGWDIERRLIAIVVRLDERPPPTSGVLNRQPALAAALRQPVLERDPAAAVAQFSHEVVVLTKAFEGDGGRIQAQGFLDRIIGEVSRFVGLTVSAGQSRPVDDVADIRRAYAQASDALVIGREIYGAGTVQHFADLGAYRLLWQVGDPAELELFASEMLGPLLGDERHSDKLLETLDVLLSMHGNMAETARALDLHYNTVRRRVDRLEEVLGPVTSDRRTRMNVELALLAARMNEGKRQRHIRGLG